MTRRTFGAMTAGLVLVLGSAWANPVRAQGKTPEPVISLTVKSAGEVIADLRYLVSAVAPPDDPRAAQVLALLDGLKDPAALKGIDPSKPIGIYGSMPAQQGGAPSAVAFIPVLDFKAFLATLEGVGATVAAESGGPGFTHTITLPGGNAPPLNALNANGYLFLSLTPTGADALKALKPAALLPTRKGAGDIALTIRVDLIPQQIKDMFFAQVDQNLAPQRERNPGETDSEFAGRQAGMKLTIDAFTALVRDGKELSLDVIVDPKKEEVGLELNSSAVAGSAYAKGLNKLGALKTKFRSLTTDAPIGFYAALPVPETFRTLLSKAFDDGKVKGLEQAKTPGEKAVIAKLVDSFRPMIQSDTLETGLAIRGPFLAAKGGAPTFVLVGGVGAKGAKGIESAVREAVAASSPEEKAQVALDTSKVDGVSIHKFTPKADAKEKMGDDVPLGDPALYASFRDDTVIMAAGEFGLPEVKKALAATKTPALATAAGPQVELFVSASKLANLSTKKEDREAMQAAAADVFKGASATRDKIRATLRAEGNAMAFRIGGDVAALKFLSRLGARMEAAQVDKK